MDPPPPPPPPHGENPKTTSGLPPGKYDIFIVPPHSSGSGFLYLPSLKPNVNSFAAGFASALILVALASAILPTVHLWWSSIRSSGGAGMMLVSVGLAIGAWAVGRMQSEGGFSGKSSGNGRGDASAGAPPGGPPPRGGAGGQNGYAGGGQSRSAPPPQGGYTGGVPPQGNGYGGGPGGWGSNTPPPKPNGWQQRDETPPHPSHNTGYTPNNHNTSGSNAPPPRPEPNRSGTSGWERAREETRRKEEERKRAAESQRQREEDERKLRAEKEEAERKLKEAREKEQKEREAREAARERIAREAREARAARDAKIAQEKREKEEAAKKAAEAEARAKTAAEKKKAEAWAAAKAQAAAIQARQAAEKEKKEAEEEAARKLAALSAGQGTQRRQGSSYAYSATGEKTNPWPKGYPAASASVSATTTTGPRPAPGSTAAAAAARRQSPSPTKRSGPPQPTAKTTTGTEDSYSYRPYDLPKPSGHKKAASSIYSGTSYAESATTSATSAPPSMRGAYSTKDPDKIVIKAVYSFTNALTRTPATQLVSGTGSVTDGLILRITTEGLFIDDDVRHVPQREWDVKAWTLKLVEVGCPCFPKGFVAHAPPAQHRKLFGNNASPDKDAGLQGENADKALLELLGACKETCRLGFLPGASSIGSSSRVKSSMNQADNRNQTGQSGKLHVLRASIRDEQGKKYVFVIGEEEGWKIAVGLQRLRKGTQVRSLGVCGLSKGDVASTLTNLGWA